MRRGVPSSMMVRVPHGWPLIASRLALGVSLTLGLWLLLHWQLSPDVSWFVHIAERMRDGARLYVDLREVNPPLGIWLLQPFVEIAHALGVADPRFAPMTLAAVEVGLALGVSAGVLRTARTVSPCWITSLLAMLGFAMLWLPAGDLAQREHQVFVLLAPYLVLAVLVLGREDPSVPIWLRLAVGLLAGVAISFKPHFVIAGVGFEIALWLVAGRPRHWWRPEHAGAGLAVLVYGIVLVTAGREFFRMVEEFGSVYLEQYRSPLVVLLGHTHVLIALPVVYLALREPRQSLAGRIRWVFGAAAMAFLLVAVIQGKGWAYHYYPALASAVVSAAAGVHAWGPHRAGRNGLVLTGSVLGIAAYLTLDAHRDTASGRLAVEQEVARIRTLVANHAQGAQVLLISSEIADAYPVLMLAGTTSAADVPSFWMAVAAERYDCSSAAAPALSLLQGAARRALMGPTPPRLVLIRNVHLDSPCHSLHAMLGRDSAVARALASYRPVVTEGKYLVVVR